MERAEGSRVLSGRISRYEWYAIAAIALLALGSVVVITLGRARPFDRLAVPSTTEGPAAGAKGKLRVVSLSPSTTEIMFALGKGDALVGVTDTCNYPPAALKITRVGGFGTPNVEMLLSLAPDLVVTAAMDERSAASDALRKSGIRLLNLKINSFQELFDAALKIGDAVGAAEKARELVAGMQKELADVAARWGKGADEKGARAALSTLSTPAVSSTPSTPRENGSEKGSDPLNGGGPTPFPTRFPVVRPRVFVEIWGDPLTTVGGKSFVDEVVRCAGGINVAHDLPQPYPTISPEKVIEWNPDVIIVCYMARKGGAAAEVAGRIGWQDIAAVKQGRIIDDLPNDLILRPGPRLIEGVKELAQRLSRAPTAKSAPAGGDAAPAKSVP